ncbi:Transcription initiation factor IIA subunit 2 [Coemansia erecta]|nr:Transcription initiation factor IIA subunit 2 [Coemansia erecta]
MLTDALDEQIRAGCITPQLAMRVLEHFDQCMSDAFASRVKAKATMEGHLRTYRYCDDVWTFIMKTPTIKVSEDLLTPEWLKIVACNAKIAKEAS